MAKIEVGMLVEVIVADDWCKEGGLIGRVIAEWTDRHPQRCPDTRYFDVEGSMQYHAEEALRPIKDDDDQASWEAIHRLTNWNPTKQRAEA